MSGPVTLRDRLKTTNTHLPRESSGPSHEPPRRVITKGVAANRRLRNGSSSTGSLPGGPHRLASTTPSTRLGEQPPLRSGGTGALCARHQSVPAIERGR